MQLTHKERLRRAIRHEPVDRLPTQINYTGRQGEQLAPTLALPWRNCRTDSTITCGGWSSPMRRATTKTESVKFDWWGAASIRARKATSCASAPSRRRKDLDAMTWPDPHDPHLLDDAARRSRRMTASISSSPTLAGHSSNGPGRCVAWSSSLWIWRATRVCRRAARPHHGYPTGAHPSLYRPGRGRRLFWRRLWRPGSTCCSRPRCGAH